jgi:hydroxyethylthiazole kinase-like uncharacterized protein yjeF
MQNRQGEQELITAAQMRSAEAVAIAEGTSGARLMERAGRGVADAIAAELAVAEPREGARPVVILCGPGNNGGDGYVIARVLKDRGHPVTIYGLVPAADLKGDALAMAQRWEGPTHPPRRFFEHAPTGEETVIVDALFGTGLSRPVDGDAAKMIAHANAMPGIKVAVDIPSGIDSDTGAALGAAFAADMTVTFHALKPGHLLRPGARHCGDVALVDIGLGAQATTRARLATDGPEIDRNDGAALLARLGTDPDGHKYTRGHALVFAGGMEGVGAARLAARAALRSGAGLVTLAVPASALMAHAARGPDALMLRRCEGEEGITALLADARRNALVIGPAYGVGEATRAAVAAVLAARRAAVLDADALTSFAGKPDDLATLTRAAGNTVITPHAGEFARLFAEEEPQAAARTAGRRLKKAAADPLLEAVRATPSPLHQALAAAAFLSAVVVLKGPATIIAAPDGRAAINTNAPPWLGTAGSGDVLAGLIGGLLAQGLAPYDAARAGVWLHGEAGQAAGRGLIADDLPEAVKQVLERLV